MNTFLTNILNIYFRTFDWPTGRMSHFYLLIRALILKNVEAPLRVYIIYCVFGDFV